VVGGEFPQLLAILALEHELHATELVELVEIRGRSALAVAGPVGTELVDHGVEHHAALAFAESEPLPFDGVLGEYVHATAVELTAQPQQCFLEVAEILRTRR